MLDVLGKVFWIAGLSGVLATISYGHWYRSIHQRSWRLLFGAPRFLFPLCLSSTLFCTGVAISGRSGVPVATWYETLVWLVLAVLFAGQGVLYYLAGKATAGKHRRRGCQGHER